MSIKFKKENNELFIIYNPKNWSVEYIDNKIKESGEFILRRTFRFKNYCNHIDDDFRKFKLAELQGEYWVIDKIILDIKYDLKISTDLNIDKKIFIAERDISVFSKLDKLIEEKIIVGGNDEEAIPLEVFYEFLKKFPTTTEMNHYASARIEGVLGEYFPTMTPSESKLDAFLKRKLKYSSKNGIIKQSPTLVKLEISKFEYVYQEIEELLKKGENKFYEREWQNKILEIIQLIFPKYIAICENVQIYDFYTEENERKSRYIDLLLIDFNGNVDILELKRPFDNRILCTNPKNCRDNYIPHRELSTALMQAEKYIFHLNKWGKKGEETLTKNLNGFLPENFKIKISNPKAIILLGRSHQFDDRQILDFEIIKKQFSHIADIMSYDDLLNRVGNILSVLKKNNEFSND